ncbi:linear amide C-N hydrolase [Marinobacter sp. NFXS9]|uniref:linear amide C-N hydrolase n=1 Tax=Marinobacter sp. NFXS9 TaxID=2818433 RepID=UPI0032DFC863
MFGKPSIARLNTALLAAILTLMTSHATQACTRILWSTDLGVFTGRTMDWPETTEPVLMAFPRGIERDGGILAGHRIVQDNPARWTSKYGSVVTATYGIGAIDGMNERGLAVHLLYFNATDFGPRDTSKQGLQAGLWGQYLLDNAATVGEAIDRMDDIQLVMVEARGHKANLHLAVEDETGDSAIMEYENGTLHIYHDRKYRVMTNDPAFPEQLKMLGQQDYSNPSRDMTLPGNVNPIDRFQRASYFLNVLKEPASDRAAVATMMSLLYNVSVPIGAPYKGRDSTYDSYSTEYRTIADQKRRRYFLQLSTLPGVIWVDLASIDLSRGASVMTLDPNDWNLFGNVTGQMKAVKDAPF